MPFFWNDETFWERMKKSKKAETFLFVLIFFNYIILYIIWHKNLETGDLIALSLVSSNIIFSIIDFFIKFRHPAIPDTYPEWAKTGMRILFFMLSVVVFYWLLSKFKLI